jgi:hypothetical protein
MACNGGAVVVGRDCRVTSITDTDTARLLFLGKLTTIQGQEMTVVFQQHDSVRRDFEIKVMGQTGAQLNNLMSQLIYAGEAKPPLLAYDDSNVKLKVNAVTCAVGFISDAAVDDSVKIVLRY